MRSVRPTLFAFALWSVTMSVGRAEEYTEYTSGTPTNPGSTVTSTPSSIGLVVNLAPSANGAVLGSSTIASSSVAPGSYLIVDQNLDAANSGTLSVNGGEIHLQNSSSTASVLISNGALSLGTLTYTSTGLKYDINFGPVAVTTGNYAISSSTPGSVTLNGGTIRMVGTILGSDIDGTLDFGLNPITFPLGSLGAALLSGYADGNAAGTDNDTAGHVSNVPGSTGISIVDTDGAELLINLGGTSETTNLYSGTITLPLNFQLTGSVYVSVPEVSSVVLMGGAFSGFSLLWLRRSKV